MDSARLPCTLLLLLPPPLASPLRQDAPRPREPEFPDVPKSSGTALQLHGCDCNWGCCSWGGSRSGSDVADWTNAARGGGGRGDDDEPTERSEVGPGPAPKRPSAQVKSMEWRPSGASALRVELQAFSGAALEGAPACRGRCSRGARGSFSSLISSQSSPALLLPLRPALRRRRRRLTPAPPAIVDFPRCIARKRNSRLGLDAPAVGDSDVARPGGWYDSTRDGSRVAAGSGGGSTCCCRRRSRAPRPVPWGMVAWRSAETRRGRCGPRRLPACREASKLGTALMRLTHGSVAHCWHSCCGDGGSETDLLSSKDDGRHRVCCRCCPDCDDD